MNLNPELSTGTAIVMSLVAASMWGTWAISLKYLEDFPLDGFLLTLFTTSVIFVWTVGFLLEGSALAANVAQILQNDPIRILGTIVGGILYVYGMRFSLLVIRSIGMSLAQPINSSISILIGTTLSAMIGGLPEGVSFIRLMLAAVVLVGAVGATMLAGYYRSVSTTPSHTGRGMRPNAREVWKALGFVVVGSLFAPAYPLALSFGLRSSTHPEGLAVLPFMAILATGAFIGAVLTSGVSLARRGQLGMVISAPFRIRRWGVGSGLFHYGGNILHTFATVHLSSAVSWPLGVSSGFWTLAWGLLYGEFEGASRRAYMALVGAIAMYLCGVYLIADTLY